MARKVRCVQPVDGCSAVRHFYANIKWATSGLNPDNEAASTHYRLDGGQHFGGMDLGELEDHHCSIVPEQNEGTESARYWYNERLALPSFSDEGERHKVSGSTQALMRRTMFFGA